MTEIKANLGDLLSRRNDLNAANLDMPLDAKLKCGSSKGDGFDSIKSHFDSIQDLLVQYSRLLGKDISALDNVSRNLDEADKRAASALKGDE